MSFLTGLISKENQVHHGRLIKVKYRNPNQHPMERFQVIIGSKTKVEYGLREDGEVFMIYAQDFDNRFLLLG